MLVVDKSKEAFREALKSIPGSVNSPVRAFGAVGGDPLFIESGHGCYLNDIDGNRYVDYVLSWGPLILGHLEKSVVKSLKRILKKGTSFGAPTELETHLAQLVKEAMPSIEKIRMVNSGTEATMSAIRLARGYTRRDVVIKFDGCYHGHVDGLLVQAGSGATTLGVPTSPGVPQDYVRNTVTIPFNDLGAVKEVCKNRGEEIACIILEPVAGNMGVIPPQKGYLKGLRKIADKHGIVLIFDEVMTGFRTALGGAQSVYGVTPDLTTLGKVIGGGLPVGAFGGCAEIMDMIAPIGAVYQAGTLAGSPLAVAAGLAMLDEIAKPDFYTTLETRASQLLEGLRQRAGAANIPFTTNQVGAMFGCFFSAEEQVSHFSQVMNCNNAHFQTYFHTMLSNGVYLAPSSYEAGFISAAHSEEEIAITLDAAELAFAAINK